MRKITFVLLNFCFGINVLIAQFQGGIASSNHSGVLGISINPANTNYLNNGTDFLLGGFSGSVLNNGFYLKAKPITQYINGEIVSSITKKDPSNPEEGINEKFDRIYNIQRSLKPSNYIFTDATILGPSFLINHKKHSFGLSTSVKTNSNTIDLSPNMAIFLLKGANAIELVGKSTNLNYVTSSTMVYTDIAFNYSYQVAETFKGLHRLGFSAHYLNGINSIIFQDNNNAKWDFIGDSTIYMNGADFIFSYAATKSGKIAELLESRGTGFALDLGYTYTRKKKGRPTRKTICPNIRYLGKIREYQEYKWKLGVALMDIGYINFKNQTSINTYENATGDVKNLDLSFYSGVFALERALNFAYSNPPTIYTKENNFTHYTATRLNVQFDYAYKNGWYFNFSGSHRLPVPGALSLRAPNILSLTTRYEKDNFDLYIPINLIEYQYPVLGFGFRAGPFFMGTNHLLELVGLRNIRGADIYLGLKFNLSNFRGV